jgi:hypothetical protein
MKVQRITEARAGFEHWTLRCTRCGRIDQVQLNTDPLKSEAVGWTEGELRPTALDARSWEEGHGMV